MYIAHDLSDEFARQKLTTTLNALLELVDERPLSGWMKVWLYNYYVAPKLSWMLMVYDLPLSVLETLESTCNRYLKRWLGLAHGATPAVLYLKVENHGLGLHSIVTLFKRLQAIKLLLLANSSDPAIRRMYERLKQKERNKTRKFDAFDTVDQHETFIANTEALNEQARLRTGLGHADRNQTQRPPSAAARRQAVSERIADMDNKERLQHLRTLQVQGNLANWDHIATHDRGWRQLFTGAMSDKVLRFHVNARLKTLPSEANKKRWRMLPVDSVCRLRYPSGDGTPGAICGAINPTEMHVLCNCEAALRQGRFTWRHNSALLVLKAALIPHLRAIRDGTIAVPQPSKVQFRSETTGLPYNHGESAPPLQPQHLRDWLALATDWTLTCDLPGDSFSYRNGVFPPSIAATDQRPDMLLVSESAKAAICLELTVPKEERIQQSHEAKAAKYQQLVEDAASNGWRLSIWPIEIGARGFVARSTWAALRALAFGKARATDIRRELELVTSRCSYYLWTARNHDVWDEIPLAWTARPAHSSQAFAGSS
eukprot:TRINITY_DN796_c0_g1_i6.p1 TRINITY_DN796_c0_g1~~TRINITY_DN796_c0_g1_i6.p1  ORF type:complete len:542 (-),score=157.79 TRINITY_DN796_c0_g1_i6:981-2606(-)